MLITEHEAIQVRNFIDQLNDRRDSAVAVEGMRDADALRRLGFSGRLLQFHRFGGMAKFADAAARYKRVIILFDGDRKGRYLTSRAMRLLERRTSVDLSFKRRLRKITCGKVMFTEQLVYYERCAA